MNKACWRGGLMAAAVFLSPCGFAQSADPPASWLATGRMLQPRASACSVRLADGRVLVAGGTGLNGKLASAEIYGAGAFFAGAASMAQGRSGHTCTLLADGRVLVVGGDDTGAGSAEIYDPASDAWQTIPATSQARSSHTATLLSDGRVLIAGGAGADGPVASLEIYDVNLGALAMLDPALATPRTSHTAVRLNDGRVWFAGGKSADGVLSSSEIYDPLDGSLVAGPALTAARAAHSATVLDDGRVLVAGGANADGELDSAEILDAAAAQIAPLGVRLNSARRDHIAVLIPGNGGVLLAGGSRNGAAIGATEVYLPLENTFLVLGSLTAPRTNMAAAALDDGVLLAIGGQNANGPQDLCGLLFTPTIRLSASSYHPQETITLSGSNFLSGVTLSLSLDLGPAGGAMTSANSRLLTTSFTVPGTVTSGLRGFSGVPITNTITSDAGKQFRVTVRAGTAFTATALAPVRAATAVSLSLPAPQFEGLNATVLAQITRTFTPTAISGSITTALDANSFLTPLSASNQSAIFSYPLTNLAAGIHTVSSSYTGDTAYEPSSANGSYEIVSRTPTVQLSTDIAQPQVGVPFQIRALVQSAGPVTTAPAPSGAVSIASLGFTLGTAARVSSQPGASAQMLASMPFTALSAAPMTVTGAFAGDSTYHAATSGPLTISFQRAATKMSINPLPASMACGASIPIHAILTFPSVLGLTNRAVSISALGADGSVRFISLGPSGSLVPSAAVAGRADANASVILPLSTSQVSVSFTGDGLLGPASATTTAPAVQPVASQVQFDPLPATVTGSVVLRVRVTSTGNCGAPAPTGTVQFLENGVLLGPPQTLSTPTPIISDGSSNTIITGEGSATATLAVSRPVGAHTIQARYSGDSLHQTATSAPITITFQ